jgi:mono/diheme cytochrome c family protein/glucose/arabinose dehydrogenase
MTGLLPMSRPLRIACLVSAAGLVASVGLLRFSVPVAARQQGSTQPAVTPTVAGSGSQGGANARGGRMQTAQTLDDPANAGADFSPKAPVRPVSPAEEAKRFWLPAGYHLQPVLSEPDIEDPAQVAFDGNGRMFVVEIRSYMSDTDATGQMAPVNRISMHEDRDGDGIYERHTVFVDGLIFPRFVLPFGANAILTMESNADEVWKFTDTNGDGVADKKELFATNFGRAGNVQLQQSGLFLGLDNWMYSTFNAFRVRWTANGLRREPTGPNGGSWGVTQDNYGKLWFQSGASGMPGYFQFPVHYGNFAVSDQFEPDLTIMWGAPVLTADMHDGMPEVRMPDGSLSRGTASAGNDIYRGDRLPKDLVGDYLYGEVVGRLVRRLRPVVTEGLTQLRNVYPLSEFIRSVDPLFRPTDVATAPDGTLYIADMYRGVVEESEWTRPGTYIRRKIEQYQLDKVLHHGRIWRLTYDGIPRDLSRPNMLQETPAQLVAHLSHPNGWWRDTAQQLLVLQQDTSVLPALRTMLRTSKNQLARIHALWTLEGLGGLTPALARQVLADADPVIRIEAIRASETVYKAGDKSLGDEYRALTKDKDTDVVIQAMLTLNVLKAADTRPALIAAMDSNKARGVQFVADHILNPPANAGRGGATAGGPVLTPDQLKVLERGGAIYTELCFACHGDDGHGTPTPGGAVGSTLAPSLAGSPRVNGPRDYVINAVLHGLTGPIEGKAFSQVMVPMGSNNDEWVADIASYVRNSFGNSGPFVTPADVARVRAATAARRTPWSVDELERTLPTLLIPDSFWKATASHNATTAANALSWATWTTGVAQQAGMWFALELPQPAAITEIQFESPIAPGRGGGASGFPRAYRVEVSIDGVVWRPMAEGRGDSSGTVVTFSPVPAKFVRITETATVEGGPAWSIQRLRLYRAPTPVAPLEAR